MEACTAGLCGGWLLFIVEAKMAEANAMVAILILIAAINFPDLSRICMCIRKKISNLVPLRLRFRVAYCKPPREAESFQSMVAMSRWWQFPGVQNAICAPREGRLHNRAFV